MKLHLESKLAFEAKAERDYTRDLLLSYSRYLGKKITECGSDYKPQNDRDASDYVRVLECENHNVFVRANTHDGSLR